MSTKKKIRSCQCVEYDIIAKLKLKHLDYVLCVEKNMENTTQRMRVHKCIIYFQPGIVHINSKKDSRFT